MLLSARMLLAALAASPGVASAAQGEVLTAPLPSWVELAELPTPDAGAPAPGGLRTLLVSDQVNRVLDPPEFFGRAAWQVTSSQGIDVGSDVQLGFDPAHEDLVLHSVTVHRDGVAEERLELESVRVLERETGLESGLVDGYRTAVLMLEDVRVGDVIEYRFTRRGGAPVFGQHYDDFLYLDSGQSAEVEHRSLVWPADRPLQVRRHRTELSPEVRHLGGAVVYSWTTSGGEIEDPAGAPAWYSPWPWVQVSDFDSWGEVVDWAVPLYALDPEPAPEVAAVLDELRRASSDLDGRALAALRFVQDEVRYLGLLLGEGTHVPTAPGRVVAQRFGDCKGKSLLLVRLLRELGLEAAPALVSSEHRRGVAGMLPGIGVFDHVIVHARHGSRQVWIDPTRSETGGGFWEQWCPDYGRALLIAPGNSNLREVRRPRDDSGRVVRYDFGPPEQGDETTLQVTTEYAGSWADRLRAQLQEVALDDYGESCRAYYAGVYPDVRSGGPVVVDDDREGNRLTVVESYLLPGFWIEDGLETYASLYALEIDGALPAADGHPAGVPLGIPSPEPIRVDIEVPLGAGWDVEPGSARISNEVFTLTSESSFEGGTLRLVHDLAFHTDAIAADSLAAYADELELALAEIDWNLTRREPPSFEPARVALGVLLALPVVLLVGALLWLAGALQHKHDPAAAPWPVPLSVLIRPRATFEWGLEHRPRTYAAPIAALLALRTLPQLEAGTLVVQALALFLAALLYLHLAGLVLAWYGRRIGGSGDRQRLTLAVAWASLPAAAIDLPIELVAALLRSSEAADPSSLHATLYTTLSALRVAGTLWFLAVLVIGVSAAHSVSKRRAAGMIAASYLVVALVACAVASVASPFLYLASGQAG